MLGVSQKVKKKTMRRKIEDKIEQKKIEGRNLLNK